MYTVSSQLEISSTRKQGFREQKKLLVYWTQNDTLKEQLKEDLSFKTPVFSGKFCDPPKMSAFKVNALKLYLKVHIALKIMNGI